jgi:mono/diheme cytochrome c family protein
MMRSIRGTWTWGLAAAAAIAAGTAVTANAADAPNPEGVKLFEAKIRPILAQSCVGCHGPDKQKGSLRLDTQENMLKGGKDENEKVIKVVEPGNPDKSMIIEAVEYKNEDLQMPPPKKKESRKLSDEQIKDLREWVKLGAPYGEKPVEAPPKAEK